MAIRLKDKLKLSDGLNTTSSIDAGTMDLSGVLTMSKSNGSLIATTNTTDAFGYNATAGKGHYIKGTGSTYVYGGGTFFDGSTTHTLLHDGSTISTDQISNLSGTNTGDQVLPTDFVSAASGGTFANAVNIADIIDGDFTALRLMNQKTYGSGTGTNEKVRFVMGISESGYAYSAREGFAIDFGIKNESDSSDGVVDFKVRDGGTLGTYQTVHGHNKSVSFVSLLTAGNGTQASNTDAMLTLRATNFSGLDFKSARTAGNIGGIRFYDTASDTVPEAQFLVEVDGSYNFYNGTNGAQLRFKVNSDGDATFAGKVSVGGGDTSTAQVALKGQQSLLSFIRGTSGDAQFFISSDSARLYFSHTDIQSTNLILTLNQDESATFAGDVTAKGNLFLGENGGDPQIDMLYVDHASGERWDTRIFIGKSNNLPGGSGEFPTYTPAGAYGIQFQANSDGAFFGMEEYTSGHYRPIIQWGDDNSDTPFRIKHENGSELEVSWDGNVTATTSFIAPTLSSTVATGTPPLTVTSTTKVNNLNAHYFDGASSSYFLNTSSNGQTKTGALDVGALKVDGKKVLDLPSHAGSERGPWNPIVSSIRGSGKTIHIDEEFLSGNNSVSVYNNQGGDGVVITRETDDTTLGATAPNDSGYVLKIVHNGNSTSPGHGGFVQNIPSEDNHTFVQIFQAKLDTGRSLVLAENPQGSNNASYWLTNTAGTGKWEWYARVSHCGDSGTFSSGGHVYVTGGTSSFTWYLASCTLIDVTDASGDYLRLSGGVMKGNAHFTDPSTAGTSAKLQFGTNTSWNNNIGLESYWMVLGSNQNEGFKFKDSSGNMLLQLNGGNSTGGTGALSATFAGTLSAPFITASNANGAANGTAQEMARIVNVATGATSSYLYIGASSGTDWRLGKNINGTTSNTNFGITKHSGTTLFLEIDGSGNTSIHGNLTSGGSLTAAGNLYLGSTGTENFIAFKGTTGDSTAGYTTTYIGEYLYGGTEQSELILYKGNDGQASTASPDRIRLIGANLCFDVYNIAQSYPTTMAGVAGLTTTRAMTILANSNVGIGTTSPQTKLHVKDGAAILNVSDDWHQSSNKTHLLRGGKFNSSIDEESTAVKVFNGGIQDKVVGNYWGGIGFMHLDPENSTWGTAFQGDHFWIGGRLIDTPAQERSALVFAVNSGTTAGSHSSEKMVILPDGNVGIGSNAPTTKLDIGGGINATGKNFLNQSNQYNNSTPGVTGFGNKSMDTSISYYDTGKTVATATRGIVWTGKHYIVTDYQGQTAKFYDSNFDTMNRPTDGTINLPNHGNTDHPHGAAWDGRYLYCIQYGGSGGKIVAYDLDNGTTTASIMFTKDMNNPGATYDVEYAEGHLYTVTDGAVSKYKLEGNSISHVHTSGNILSSLEAQSITYDGSYLWITQNGNYMYQVRLDCTLKATLTTAIPPENVAMAWNGQNTVSVNHTNGKVYVINTAHTRFDTEKFSIMGGNVGIGTASPAVKLHVNGTNASVGTIGTPKNDWYTAAYNGLQIADGLTLWGRAGDSHMSGNYYVNTGGSGGAAQDTYINSLPANDFWLDNSSGSLKYRNAVSGTAGDAISFSTRFVVLNNGNFGIGTTSPVQPFQVNGQVLFRTTTVDGGKNRFQLIPGGSADAANLYLYYGNTGDGTLSVRINAQGNSYFNGGNVGIGSTSPGAKLDVVGNVRTSTYYNFHGNPAIPTDTTAAIFDQTSVGPTISGLNVTFRAGTPTPAEIMRVDDSGNVGIGTTSPNYKLEVNGTGLFTGVLVLKGQASNYDATTGRTSYWDYDDKVALALEPAADDGAVAIFFKSIGNAPSDFGYIVFDEDYGEAGVTAGENSALIIGCENDGINSSDHVRVKGRLVVEADMSSSDPTKAFQVKASNTTSDLFHINRAGGGYLSGTLNVTGDVVAYYSDMRLKTKLEDLTGAVSKIKMLNSFYYEPNEKALELGYKKERRIGLSAQEVQEVLPEAVSKASISHDPKVEEDYLSVDYAKLVPLLVEGIKELKAEIEELKKQIK